MSKNISKVITGEGVIEDQVADQVIAEGSEKFGYLAEKDPSPKHEFYAAAISALTGVEVTPKQYQAMICTHRYIQASDLNRARPDYRPRTVDSVIKASETLLENAAQLSRDGEGNVIAKSATHIPEESIPADVLTNWQRIVTEEVEAGATEAEAVAEANAQVHTGKITKAELIQFALDAGSDLSEAQLKKLTVKKLRALLDELSVEA